MTAYPIRRTPRGKLYMTVRDAICYDSRGIKHTMTATLLDLPIIGYTTCLTAWKRGIWHTSQK